MQYLEQCQAPLVWADLCCQTLSSKHICLGAAEQQEDVKRAAVGHQ